jgi:precorrin-6B methylase 2
MSEQTGTFTLGRAFKPESIDDDAVRQMVAILDAQDGSPSIERLRAWALERAAVRPGERAIDVGSGTGTMTRRLAAAVGATGEAMGIEPNGMLRGVAADRAAAEGSAAV